MSAQPSPAAQPSLPLPQHVAGLWARAGERLYAVVDGGAVSGLPQLLAQSDLADHDCLLPGALEPREAARAGWLLALTPDSQTTRWLLEEAAAAWPDWGWLLLSKSPMLVLRQHLRGLNEMRLIDGRSGPLRWWEPRLLGGLLPVFSSAQLHQVFGPVEALVHLQPRSWNWYAESAGQLLVESRPVA